jgi:hypothetical protein
MMGYHGPKPGTIWYTIQAIFMSTLFGAGAVIIAYMAIVNGDPICFTGAVFCAIFCVLFIIGYFVDTKGLNEKTMKTAQRPSNPNVVSVQQTAPIEVPPKEEPQPIESNKNELI